ncbi:GLIPR1-like protein [Echinococcus granulosus]|uniref:GLIPR1-like protein n=1 Tax=Echinococcus granulosus TaxID=6210 RepID=W6U8S0_ECHGR|nr:GLIPR1-like protein [Echinococcus granulosus]EUB56851.1 GLIPR1-like protein [Echinococcus granulosus]
MSSTLGLVILISAATCQLPTDAERDHILEAHREVREHVFPPARNMLLMEYSKEMEMLAAYWAAHCIYEHPDRSRYPQYREVGQNLALTAGFKPSLTESVCVYKTESRFYKFANNSCSHVCGHYTQLVWATSIQVGCAMRQCDDLRPHWPNPQYLTVCQYKPPGNYVGRKPYIRGRSCSKCPRGYLCYRNQCASVSQMRKIYSKGSADKSVPECKPESFYSAIQYIEGLPSAPPLLHMLYAMAKTNLACNILAFVVQLYSHQVEEMIVKVYLILLFMIYFDEESQSIGHSAEKKMLFEHSVYTAKRMEDRNLPNHPNM